MLICINHLFPRTTHFLSRISSHESVTSTLTRNFNNNHANILFFSLFFEQPYRNRIDKVPKSKRQGDMDTYCVR